jgi:Cu(I)/Ag(I) efflux system periplasmic protein CusF
MKPHLSIIVLSFAAALAGQAHTAVAASHAAHHPASAASLPMADGEVRKVDKEQGKVTLRHGPIANLDMPGMTMVFKVADVRMLDALQQGDKVRFTADKVDGTMTVTAIEAIK